MTRATGPRKRKVAQVPCGRRSWGERLTGYGGKWIQSAALALALMLGLMLLPSLPSHAQIVAPDPTDALEASDPADVGEDDPDALLGAADDGLPAAEIGVVAAVYSGNTLRLADGREVVLPHVMPPGADRFRPLEQRRFDRRATMGLADMVLGRTVRIDLAPIARDRRGRLRARLILMEGDAQPPDPADIAVRLVTAGMVRVMPESGAYRGFIGGRAHRPRRVPRPVAALFPGAWGRAL